MGLKMKPTRKKSARKARQCLAWACLLHGEIIPHWISYNRGLADKWCRMNPKEMKVVRIKISDT